MPNNAPTLGGFAPSITFAENVLNATPQLLDGDVTFTDLEGNFNGGALTVAGLLAEDRVAVRNQGNAPGEIGVSGTDILYGGTIVGSFAGGTGTTFSVTLNGNASSAAIDALIQNLTYANVSDTPTAFRHLALDVTDAAGAHLGPVPPPADATFVELTGAANPFDGVLTGFNQGSPAFADLDGDGDMDLLVGGYGMRLFRNDGGTFTEQTGAANPFDNFASGGGAFAFTPSFADIDGDGDLDLVVGNYYGTLRTFLNDSDGADTDSYDDFTELTGPANPFAAVLLPPYSKPAFADLDGDGDMDLVVGGANESILHAYRNDDGSFTELTDADNPFDGIDTGFRGAPSFFDIDGDGDADLIVGRYGGALRVYRNDGDGADANPYADFTQLGTGNPFDGIVAGNNAQAAFGDIDGDGDLDMVLGGGTLRTFDNAPSILVQVTAGNDPPIVDLDGGGGPTSTSLSYSENDPATRIATAATFSDPDSSNFSGGKLTVSFTANGEAADRLSIVPQGNAPGQIGFSDSFVLYGGVVIGTYSGGTNGSTPLVIDLTGNANKPAVEALIHQIAYFNVSETPSTAAREVSYVLEDGDGGTPFASLATIDVAAVNDEPSGQNATLTIDEDTTHIFVANDFGFSDVDNSLLSVKITTAATNGALLWDSDADGGTPPVVVADGDEIPVADVDAGRLTFVPGLNESGGNYASFTFQVRDDGGTPGLDLDQSENLFTFNVTAVNDAPFFDLDSSTSPELDTSLAFTEGDPPTAIAPLALFSDVDQPANYDGYTLTAELTDNGTDDDALTIISVGTGPGEVSVTGSNIFYQGVQVATFTGGTGGTPLVIVFDADACACSVQLVTASIAFSNASDKPSTDDRTMTFTIDDGAATDATANAIATISVTAVNDPPIVSNYDTLVAASGTGPIDLRIAAPTDIDGDPMTITLTGVPGYGIVEYFDGAAWVAVTGGETLSSAELVSLRYTPPASGEFGGETIAYEVYDGTATVEGVIEITSQVVTADPQLLLFAAIDDNTPNPDLYTVDAAGVLHNPAINPPNGSFAGEAGGFAEFGGASYFYAFGPGIGTVLFRMDSSGASAPVDDGVGGHITDLGSVTANFTRFAGGLYFAGDLSGGVAEAIRLDADGTLTGFNVNPGNPNFAGANGGFVIFDGSLFFSAVTTLTNGNNSPDLIRLDQDGTTHEITTRGAGLEQYGSFAGEDGGFIVFNNALYFNAYYDVSGDTLFRLDAGSSTPVPVNPFGTILDHINTGGIDSAFHVFAGSLYFNEFSSASGGDSLFKLDGGGSLTEIRYLNSALTWENLVGAGAMGGFIDFAGSTWFTASTSETGLDLFRLDDCGCLEAIDVNIGPADAFDLNLPAHFTIFGGALYFDAYDDLSGSDHLYRLTADGFLDMVDLGGGGTTHAGVEGGFQQAFGSLFFSAYTGDGYEIVRLEQDGSFDTYDINPGPGGNAVIPGNGQTFGLLNGNTLTGGAGKDIIVGSAATETLSGGGGDDVLEARGGTDHLAGGDGADLFVLSQTGAANLVTLDDYDLLSGDKVDLSALLDAGFGPNSSVSDFARLFAVEGDLKLQIDADGRANGIHWTDVAILTGGNTLAPDSVEVHFNGADYSLTETFNFNLQTVALAGGGWAVTWSEPSLEDGFIFANVFGRVFAADGSQIGGTFQISADDNGMDDENNLVAALTNGDFAVVWQACENEIWTRVYHADGTPATDPVAVQPPDPDVVEILPGGIVALSNGGYAVLWDQLEAPANGGLNVYISTFAADGTPAAGPVLVNSVGAGSPDHHDGLTVNFEPLAIAETTQIVKLANGFAVAWLSGRHTGPAGALEDSVFVRVFDNDGNPVTGEIQANTDGGVNSVDGGVHDYHPELVALSGNNFALVWESDVSGSDERMFARIFDDADYTAGAPIRLDANADPDVLAETWDATALVNGGFVSLWDQSSVSGADIYIQIFDAAGAIASGSVPGGLVVNQVSNVVNLPDQVLALSGGGFAVLYDSDRDDGTGIGVDTDVYVRTYTADGTPASNELRVNPADDIDNEGLALAALPNGGFVVLWAQDVDTANGGRTDILARIVGADGTPFGGPITLGSSPSDLSYAQEQSLLQEFRDAVSANGDLLAAWISDDTVDLVNLTGSLSIALLDTPPAVDLDGAVAGIDHSASYTENGAGIPIGAAIAVTDANAGDQIVQAIVTLTNAQPGDLLSTGAMPAGIGAAVTTPAGQILVTLSGAATPADYAAALAAITFSNSSDNPSTIDRTITVTINDGAADSDLAIATIHVVASDDAPVAQPDAFSTDEATVRLGNVFADNGSGVDGDVDGPSIVVSAVNGSGANVGVPITLASGAHLTLSANGNFSYNPTPAFNLTPAPGSGASNTPAHDSFTYTLTGGNTATVTVTVTGIDTNDLLIGTAGADTLDGGTGNDILRGLGGDDIYYVDTVGDNVREAIGAGNDRIYASADYTLRDGQEIEILSTSDFTGTAALALGGNEFDNLIIGNGGANILYGKGGNDILIGLGGDDVYYVDTIGDTVGEAVGGGSDRVYASADYTLRTGSEIEILSTSDFTGNAALALGGNEFDNLIIGNAGNNILYGKGGNDILIGLGGNDNYYVDTVGDNVGEAIGGGSDRVYASADYTLRDGQEIEVLSTDWNDGTTNLALGGNEFANLIIGNNGNNILYGKGGNDTLIGLGGDDNYYVDTVGDNVGEAIGGGNDRVYASADYTLRAGQEIEVLSTDWNDGTTNLALGGNELDNSIYGNNGNNILYGKGGNDILAGLGGADQFWFIDAPAAGNVDTILDFQAGVDEIVLLQGQFGNMPAGTLGANAFQAGNGIAQDADDRILYDTATGALYFDADGNGIGAAVHFATLSGAPAITVNDFTVL